MNHAFQSHAGSIEAVPRFSLGQAIPGGFNPTLVRLRPSSDRLADGPWFRFQSHAGSIEAWPPAPPRTAGRRVSIPRWFD